MSILDDNFVEHTDKLFLLGRWLPLTPHVSKIWTCHPLFTGTDGAINSNPVVVDTSVAKELCNTMFDGRMTLDELWKLIDGIEVTSDWVNQWNSIAWRTDQEDMKRFNGMLNGNLIQKIVNETIKRFAESNMHIISLHEFDMMRARLCVDEDYDWLYCDTDMLLCANWFEFPECIKITMTSNGVSFKLLRARDESTFWEPDSFILDLSPEKRLLDKPRDINEFMTYQQHNNFIL